MIAWFLAVTGSVLVLTQSSITAPVRAWLTNEPAANHGILPKIAVVRLGFGKLVSCPMCSGFWLGMAWAWYLMNRGALPPLVGGAFVYGFGGSAVAALAVAMWLALGEAYAALSLYRYLSQSDPRPKVLIPPKMKPAFANWTPTLFVCACGESVAAGCAHVMGPRCNGEPTEIANSA